jgi:hypothetical protein
MLSSRPERVGLPSGPASRRVQSVGRFPPRDTVESSVPSHSIHSQKHIHISSPNEKGRTRASLPDPPPRAPSLHGRSHSRDPNESYLPSQRPMYTLSSNEQGRTRASLPNSPPRASSLLGRSHPRAFIESDLPSHSLRSIPTSSSNDKIGTRASLSNSPPGAPSLPRTPAYNRATSHHPDNTSPPESSSTLQARMAPRSGDHPETGVRAPDSTAANKVDLDDGKHGFDKCLSALMPASSDIGYCIWKWIRSICMGTRSRSRGVNNDKCFPGLGNPRVGKFWRMYVLI